MCTSHRHTLFYWSYNAAFNLPPLFGQALPVGAACAPARLRRPRLHYHPRRLRRLLAAARIPNRRNRRRGAPNRRNRRRRRGGRPRALGAGVAGAAGGAGGGWGDAAGAGGPAAAAGNATCVHGRCVWESKCLGACMKARVRAWQICCCRSGCGLPLWRVGSGILELKQRASFLETLLPALINVALQPC